MDSFKQKYLKYKNKYLALKKSKTQHGGAVRLSVAKCTKGKDSKVNCVFNSVSSYPIPVGSRVKVSFELADLQPLDTVRILGKKIAVYKEALYNINNQTGYHYMTRNIKVDGDVYSVTDIIKKPIKTDDKLIDILQAIMLPWTKISEGPVSDPIVSYHIDGNSGANNGIMDNILAAIGKRPTNNFTWPKPKT